MKAVGVLLMVAVALTSCGDAGHGDRLLAQCLDVRPDVLPPPRACLVDAEGGLDVLDIDLAPGVPFSVDPTSGRVAAISQEGRIVAIDGRDRADLGIAAADTAYAFDDGGRLLGMSEDGLLTQLDGTLIAAFDVSGVVDVQSGFDIDGDSALLVVDPVDAADESSSIVVATISSERVRPLFESPQRLGFARWSPSGDRVAFVAPGAESIEVIDVSGSPVSSIRPSSVLVSRLVATPGWVDDDRIVLVDAVPALLVADSSTGAIESTLIYDEDAGLFPALPVALP